MIPVLYTPPQARLYQGTPDIDSQTGVEKAALPRLLVPWHNAEDPTASQTGL